MTLHGLKHMLRLCAVDYHIHFNPLKSKLVCYNVKHVNNISIQLCGQNIEAVDDVMLLGNYISNDRWKKTLLKWCKVFIVDPIAF